MFDHLPGRGKDALAEAEAAADEFGASLMYKAGGDPHALGVILSRISDKQETAPHFLLDQPRAQERAYAIARIAQPPPMRGEVGPIRMGDALKSICTEDDP